MEGGSVYSRRPHFTKQSTSLSLLAYQDDILGQSLHPRLRQTLRSHIWVLVFAIALLYSMPRLPGPKMGTQTNHWEHWDKLRIT